MHENTIPLWDQKLDVFVTKFMADHLAIPAHSQEPELEIVSSKMNGNPIY